MKGYMKTLLAMAAVALMATSVAAQTAAPAAARKLVPPARGEVAIEITAPATKRVGGDVVTTLKVKNVATAPIAGLKLEEFWYDAKGTVVGGDTFRNPKPLQPGEVITVTLTDPAKAISTATRNNYKFSHANGTIKPKTVPKL